MREKIAERKAGFEVRVQVLAGTRLNLTRQVKAIDEELEQLRGAIAATEILIQDADKLEAIKKAQETEGEKVKENATVT